MGTTLTGTTPQDTYDSLIKVGDNGPISGTAKVLSDGLGNDLPIAVSTSNVGIGTTSPNLSGSARALTINTANAADYPAFELASGGTLGFYINGNNSENIISSQGARPLNIYTNGNERLRITSAGNVGIGTSSPASKLYIVDNSPLVVGSSSGSISVTEETGTTSIGQGGGIFLGIPASSGSFLSTFIKASRESTDGSNSSAALLFGTRVSGGANTERMRITSDGYLRLATGGIQFNGDTAAANALDDYEEGTWTPAFGTGGDTTGMVYATQLGEYTKIGNLVNIRIAITLTTLGGAAGNAYIYNLPFTNGSSVSVIGSASIFNATALMDNVTFLIDGSANYISLLKNNSISGITKADLTNTTVIFFNASYRV